MVCNCYRVACSKCWFWIDYEIYILKSEALKPSKHMPCQPLEPSATQTNCPMEPYFNITLIIFIFAFLVSFSIISLWITILCVHKLNFS